MSQPWQDPNSPEGQRWHQERQEYWSGMWGMFQPPGGKRRNWFYVDVPTLLLSVVVGYPLGMKLAEALTGEAGLGGLVGIFPTMLVFGFFRRRMQLRGSRSDEKAAAPATARSPIRTLVVWTAGTAVVTGLLGVWFALSEGDLDPVAAALRFGALGAVPGFLVGVIAAWRTARRGAT